MDGSVSKDKILEELVAIGFARVADYFWVRDGELELKDPLPVQAGAAIASLDTTGKGLKVKFYDKLKALELLGKHMGMFSGRDQEKESPENNLLEAIVEATREEVDTDDLPEVQQAAAAGHDLVEPAQPAGV